MTCVFALTACRMELSNWNSKTIKASKNIVTKEYHLTPFEEVELSCVGAVELIQSESKDGVVELTARILADEEHRGRTSRPRCY